MMTKKILLYCNNTKNSQVTLGMYNEVFDSGCLKETRLTLLSSFFSGASSENDLDSDLEDRILSAVEYGTNQPTDGLKRSQKQQRPKESAEQQSTLASRSTIPPIDMTRTGTDRITQNNSSSGEDSSDDDDNSSHNGSNTPPVIHHIDLTLTDNQLPYDDSTDEEEKELNFELQQLIDNQVRNCSTFVCMYQPPLSPITQYI